MFVDKRIIWRGLLLALLALALVAGLMALRKPTPGPYGAIALSQNSLGYGTSWGYADASAAYARAQKECGRSDCAVRISLAGTCGALAVSGERNQSFAVTDSDKTTAGAFALAQCQAEGASDCAIQVDVCGGGQ